MSNESKTDLENPAPLLNSGEAIEHVEDEPIEEVDLLDAIHEDRDESTFAKSVTYTAAQDFNELKISEQLKQAVNDLGWSKPTPVQGLCLPFTLSGRDLAGFAQTGTGKTGVFLITVAELLLKKREMNTLNQESPFAVVLAPTRELAVQIHEEVEKLASKLNIRSLAVFGGMDYDKQAQMLKSGIDIVVATPGRLKDYIQKKVVSIKHTSMFVCDEVDRMFDMGFIEDVEFFLEKLPENCQKLLFSATTNDKVKELAFEYLNKPEYISVNPEEMTPESIEQHLILCDTPEKLRVLIGLIREHQPLRAVIFANTKLTAEWLKHKLIGNGLEAESITGDMPQNKRINLIRKIKAGQVKILIGTDVASRGLHISDVTHVYNFDLPGEPANYVHRIGRTARAGAKGQSFTLVCEEYAENLDGIKQLVGESIPPCTWFDEKFLDIQDVSGNPFRDGKVRGFKISERKPFSKGPRTGFKGRDANARPGSRPAGATAPSGIERSADSKSKSSFTRAKSDRFDSKRNDKPGRAFADSTPKSASAQKDRNHRFDGKNSGRADQHNRGGNRPYQGNHQKPSGQRMSPQDQGPISSKVASQDKKGLFSLIKNVVKSIFGSKES
jgi:ATP-dependent RNA helicase RhlB